MAFVIGNITSHAAMGEAAGVGHRFNHDNDKPFLLLMISRTQNGYGSLDGITFNLDDMIKINEANIGWHYCSMWRLSNADIGNYEVEITNDDDGNFSWTVGAMSVAGVNLADPVRASITKTCEPGTSLSEAVTSAAGDMCVSVCGHNEFENNTTDVGQVERWDNKFNNPPRSSSGVGSTEIAVGASTTMGHGWATSGGAQLILASFKAVGAGNQVVWMMSKIHDFFKDLREGLIPPEELQSRYRGLKEQGLLTI